MLKRRDLLMLAPGAFAFEAASCGWARAAERAGAPHAAVARDAAEMIIANARKIVRPGGIERLQTVRIGGIEQWVSIRGADPRDPVLLYIHGGPGYVSMPMSWWFGRGCEQYFTVAHWDQRGAGKTYLLNRSTVAKSALTLERMRADAEEMISWLKKELHKDKIFVLGHSWGSYLGLQMAVQHPDWLHGYIGVGQVINGPESERRGWAATLQAARRDRNAEAIRALESIAPYFAPGHPSSLRDMYVQRKWLDYYGGVMAHRRGNSAESDLARLSPDYTDAEKAHIWDINAVSEQPLLGKVLGMDHSDITQLSCPLVIFAGRYDINVNSDVAAEWLRRVSAPAKKFVWFENSAHLPMTEEPAKFFDSLLHSVRPIAEHSGDAPPA